MVDTRPLIRFLSVEQGWEAKALTEMKRSYASAARDIKRLESLPGIGASIRADQLRYVQRALLEEQAKLWQVIGSSVQAGRADAAAAAIQTAFTYDDMLLKSAFTPIQRDAYLRAAQATARRNVENVTTRVMGYSKMPLSDQVYKTKAWSNGLLDRRINAAIAKGASARELAASVRDLINPSTPGGVNYAAMRLGRTELNNAFHATSVLHYQKAPWVTGVKWELSGSHPVADECDDYAESAHYDGGDPGVFKPGDVPEKPHPNCLCFTSPVTVTDEEFLDALDRGQYDDYLDRVMLDAGYPSAYVRGSRIIDMVRSGPIPSSAPNPITGQMLMERRTSSKLARPEVAKEANTTVAKLARVELKGGTDDEINAINAALDRLGAKPLLPDKAKIIIDDLGDKLDEVNAAYLRSRREAANLSRTQVSDQSGYSVAKVARIETKGGTQQELNDINDALTKLGAPGKLPGKTIKPDPGEASSLPGKPVKPPVKMKSNVQLRDTGRTNSSGDKLIEIHHPTLGYIGDVYKSTDMDYLTGGRSYSYSQRELKGYRFKPSDRMVKIVNEERAREGLAPLTSADLSGFFDRNMAHKIDDAVRGMENRTKAYVARQSPDAFTDVVGNVYTMDETGLKMNGRNIHVGREQGKQVWVDHSGMTIDIPGHEEAIRQAQSRWIQQMNEIDARRAAGRLAQREAGTFDTRVMQEADELRANIHDAGGFGTDASSGSSYGTYDRAAAQYDLSKMQDIGEKALQEIEARARPLAEAAAQSRYAGQSVSQYYIDQEFERQLGAIKMRLTREYIAQARGTALPDRIPQVRPHTGPAEKGYHQSIRQPGQSLIDDFATVVQTYPEEWTDGLRTLYGLTGDGNGRLTLYRGSRGYFDGSHLVVSGNDTVDLLETMFHEVGHGMERAISGLRAAEQAWWEKRAGDAYNLVARDNAYEAKNVYLPTKNWYTMKRYDKATTQVDRTGYEIFTTGVQEVLGSGYHRYTDRDLETFILGVLLCL